MWTDSNLFKSVMFVLFQIVIKWVAHVFLRQLSYAIKNQLKAPKAPY